MTEEEPLLGESLRQNFKTVCLPVTRTYKNASVLHYRTADSLESAIRMAEDRVLRYLTKVSNQIQDENENFRKTLIGIILSSKNKFNCKQYADRIVSNLRSMSIEDFDTILTKYKNSKESIDGVLPAAVLSDDYLLDLRKYFIAFKENGQTSLEIPLGLNFASLLQIRDMVDEASKFSDKMSILEKSYNILFDKLNEFFTSSKYKKTLSISDNSELKLTVNETNREFSLEGLSSGEKQLFILLALLLPIGDNQGIYILDEPELSLNGYWQEKLLSAMLEINPNVQYIFATHSPEIAGDFYDKIISLG